MGHLLKCQECGTSLRKDSSASAHLHILSHLSCPKTAAACSSSNALWCMAAGKICCSSSLRHHVCFVNISFVHSGCMELKCCRLLHVRCMLMWFILRCCRVVYAIGAMEAIMSTVHKYVVHELDSWLMGFQHPMHPVEKIAKAAAHYAPDAVLQLAQEADAWASETGLPVVSGFQPVLYTCTALQVMTNKWVPEKVSMMQHAHSQQSQVAQVTFCQALYSKRHEMLYIPASMHAAPI